MSPIKIHREVQVRGILLNLLLLRKEKVTITVMIMKAIKKAEKKRKPKVEKKMMCRKAMMETIIMKTIVIVIAVGEEEEKVEVVAEVIITRRKAKVPTKTNGANQETIEKRCIRKKIIKRNILQIKENRIQIHWQERKIQETEQDLNNHLQTEDNTLPVKGTK